MRLQMLFDAPAAPPPDLRGYDWIVISSSAGKDSQAMLDHVCQLASTAGVMERVVVVHCDLGRVEWKGTADLAEAQADRYGVPCLRVWRRQGDLLEHIERMRFFPKPDTRYCTSDHKRQQIFRAFTAVTAASRSGDLLEQVEKRGMWPSPKQRYCTSDQKRAQVHRVYTALTRKAQGVAMGLTPSQMPRARILSCQGMRADESPARLKMIALSLDERASNGRRVVENWLPLHTWTVDQVWARIRASRTADLVHPAYGLGMPRLSCVFCIFAPKAALMLAGKHNPELLAEYVAVEQRIGHKFRADLALADVQAALARGEEPGEIRTWHM